MRLTCAVQADLWSLGIILFELYDGKPPFLTNNVYTLIREIVNKQIEWPKDMSAPFQRFVRVSALHTLASQRLAFNRRAQHGCRVLLVIAPAEHPGFACSWLCLQLRV